MNEHPPLEPVGDASLEARIVAWVLGEASAFEAGELERLCDERPELLVFRRRMRALHGLLSEAESAEPDEAWKLAPDKRVKIEELFGESQPEPEIPVLRLATPRRWLLKTILTAAACVMLGMLYRFGFEERSVIRVAAKSVDFLPSEAPRRLASGGVEITAGSTFELAPPSPVTQSRAWYGRSDEKGMAGNGIDEIKDEVRYKVYQSELDRPSQSAPGADYSYKAKAAQAVAETESLASATKSKLEVIREFNSPTEYEPPELPNSVVFSDKDRESMADPFASSQDEGSKLAARPPVSDAKPGMPTADLAFASGSEASLSRFAAAEGELGEKQLEAGDNDLRRRRQETQGEFQTKDQMIRREIPVTPATPTDVFKNDLAVKGKGTKNAEEFQDATGRVRGFLGGDFGGGRGEQVETAPTGETYSLGLEKKEHASAYDAKSITGALEITGKSKPGGMDDTKDQDGKAVINGDGTIVIGGLRSSDAGIAPSNIDDSRSRQLADAPAQPSNRPIGNPAPAPPAAMAPAKPASAGAKVSGDSLDRVETESRRQAQEESVAIQKADVAKAMAAESEQNQRALQSLEKGNKSLELTDEGMKGTAPTAMFESPLRKQESAEAPGAALRQNQPPTLGELRKDARDAAYTHPADLREKLRQIEQRILDLNAELASPPPSGKPRIEVERELRDEKDQADELRKLLDTIRKVQSLAPKPAPIPTDELSASGEAFSTFSLHVSDASFKVAKAALDRGERPDPESVRPEEFYNAFDYGDPTPAPGEPVACAIEQAAHPILPQRNLVRVAMRTGAAGRAASQPLNLTVLLDHSGSMEREDRHEGLNQAIVQLASLLKAGDTITVAGFSRTPRLMADRLPGERAKELIDIVRNTPSEGGTNLEEALKLGGDLALRQKNPAAQNRIVLLTDGAANLGNAKPEDLAERIRALRQQGISFDAAGLGAGGVNDRMLETLTRDGNGRYYLIDQPSDADANFAKQLAGAFRPAAENVKVQIHFNPARVGRYKLIGFEKHRLKTEDFRNDKVDAAELAAEEAGVALYQVETLPQGTGEIGEASVRFKDTSTGQMVEQTWTIPYDEKAAAFDQATPSMQLASLAALTAEKLRGGPLAEATDFQSLTPQVAKVRAHYATSKKVGDLIEMIGKLK